eukprot:2970729-Prymnesium_polylepis.1
MLLLEHVVDSESCMPTGLLQEGEHIVCRGNSTSTSRARGHAVPARSAATSTRPTTTEAALSTLTGGNRTPRAWRAKRSCRPTTCRPCRRWQRRSLAARAEVCTLRPSVEKAPTVRRRTRSTAAPTATCVAWARTHRTNAGSAATGRVTTRATALGIGR